MDLHGNSQVTTTVIADGLDNPRYLIFGSDGALYVAEAGIGGDGVSVQRLKSLLSLPDSGGGKAYDSYQQRLYHTLIQLIPLLGF